MKKIFFVLLFLVNLATTSFGQLQGQLRGIHAYELTSPRHLFGINFTGEYFPVDRFSVAPSFTVFTPAQGNARGFDLNARYYFTENDVQLYGTAGYGYFVRLSEETPVQRTRMNAVNIGLGGMLKLRDELGFNPEVRYQTGQRDTIVFKLGFVYFIN